MLWQFLVITVVITAYHLYVDTALAFSWLNTVIQTYVQFSSYFAIVAVGTQVAEWISPLAESLLPSTPLGSAAKAILVASGLSKVDSGHLVAMGGAGIYNCICRRT